MAAATLLDTLRALEVTLHQPAVCSDPAKLSALLHPHFLEFGRSGAIYSRVDTLREFSASPQLNEVWSQDFKVAELAEGIALLTYRSAHINSAGEPERHSNRSSLWQHSPSGWQLRFHQGTPTNAFAKSAI